MMNRDFSTLSEMYDLWYLIDNKLSVKDKLCILYKMKTIDSKLYEVSQLIFDMNKILEPNTCYYVLPEIESILLRHKILSKMIDNKGLLEVKGEKENA